MNLRGLVHRLRVWIAPASYAREVDAEIRFHLELDAMHARGDGLTDDDAAWTARKQFGNVTHVREEVRRMSGLEVLDRIRQDVVYAVRGLRRSPGLTATIIAIFALGIGVNSALFTVVDHVYFQAPPGLVDPGAVHRIVKRTVSFFNIELVSEGFEIRDLQPMRAAVCGLADIEGYEPATDVPIGDDGGEKRTVGYATTGFFAFSGVRPFRGRFFAPEENVEGGGARVAILGYSYWRSRLGSDTAVIGRRLIIDSALYVVIGVMQPHFEGLDLDAVDIWAPRGSRPPGMEGLWTNTEAFVRLHAGADARFVRARLQTQYQAGHPGQAWGGPGRLDLVNVLEARSSVWRGWSDERDLALLRRLVGVALLVLVIAVSNVASLLLMRSLRRQREMAVRVALGVSAVRLIRLLVIESVLLAAVGGVAAFLLATWTGGALRAVLISDVRWSSTVVDGRMIAWTALIALGAGVLAGLAPATIVLRRDIIQTLKAGSAESGRPRSALRIGLLVTQTALCMMMLASAGVFLQSLRNAGNSNRGFDADRLIEFGFGGRVNEGVVIQRLRMLPFVESATQALPLRGGGVTQVVFASGDTTPFAFAPDVPAVDPAFMKTTGLRLLAGRFFDKVDVQGAEPVAVVNRTFAERYWKGGNPIGDCIRRIYEKRCQRIVGVVGDVRWLLTVPPREAVYTPMAQSRGVSSFFIVRVHGPATPVMVAELRQILAPLSANRGFWADPRLVADELEPQMRPWRIAAAMFLLFGVLALAAAGAGIYGLVGYDVTQRTHEFGVRIALGASARSILQLVLGSGLRVVALGLVVGLAAAFALGRVIASLLFETSPLDPLVLAVTAVVLSLAALAASFVPAWRATRIDPVVALRAD